METAVSLHEPGPVARFGRFTIDTRRAELRRDGVQVALRPKTFALLTYLAAHPGRLVDKKELMHAVWPGVVVNDESLSQCVRVALASMPFPSFNGPRTRASFSMSL